MNSNKNNYASRQAVKKNLVFVLLFSLIFTSLSFNFGTKSYGKSVSDISGHWAKKYIERSISKGFVRGYPDGSFKPDKPVTRAEFATMINKALNLSGSSSFSFSDVSRKEWFYREVEKAVYSAYVGGYKDNTFKPNNAITRQEAAIMLSRIIPPSYSTGSLNKYSDKKDVAAWAYDGLSQISSKGYIGAYDDGKIHPLDKMTRAQTAKIIYSILEKEKISSSTNIKEKNTNISNTIFTNTVTIDSSLDDDSASISNCSILGSLQVYGGGENTIKIQDSRISKAYVQKKYDKVRLLLSGKSSIHETFADKKCILETSSLSGGLYGLGFVNVNVKNYSDTTLRGDFQNVNIEGSNSTTELNRAKIQNLKISRSTSNVLVKSDSSSNINTADVYSKASFLGDGGINTLNAHSSDITYETKPRYIHRSSGVSEPTYSKGAPIRIEPRLGEKNVKRSSNITIRFAEAVTAKSRRTIKDSDINDMIEIRQGRESGSKISFSGSIDSSKKVVTLNPKYDLDTDEKYYVVIEKDKFYNSDSDGNSYFSSYFYTGDKTKDDDSDYEVRVSPKNKEEDVSVRADIKLYFDRAIENKYGKRLYDKDIEDIIEIREKSTSGSKVRFSADISSSKKTITLDPRYSLDKNEKYYVIIPSSKIKYDNGKYVDSQTTCFYTGKKTDEDYDVRVSPKNKEENVSTGSDIRLYFDRAVENRYGRKLYDSDIEDIIEIREKSTSGSKVRFSADISSSKKTITLDPRYSLDKNEKYYVIIPSSKIKYDNGKYVDSQTTCFYTGKRFDNDFINFYPSDKSTNVSSNADITITFDNAIERYDGGSIYSSYIRDNLILREKDSSGRSVDFSASIDSRDKKITIDPKYSLKNNTTYYVAVPYKKFRFKSSRDTVHSASVTWTVGTPQSPTVSFSPSNGSSNVSLNSNIYITFSENLFNSNGNTPTSSDLSSFIRLKNNTTGSDVSSKVELYSGSYKVVVKPTYPLVAGNSYSVNVSGYKFKTSAGIYLNSASSSFRAAGNLNNADTSALDSKISEAESLKNSTLVSDNANKVYKDNKWVTQSEMNTFSSAINTAKNTRSSVSSTSQATSAKNTLESAINTFNNQRKDGTKYRPDLSSLKDRISAAKNLKSKYEVSSNGYDIPSDKYWVNSEAKETLSRAINLAEKALNTLNTDKEILDSVKTLNSAIETFDNSKKHGLEPKITELETQINAADTESANITVVKNDNDSTLTSGQKYVLESEKEKLVNAKSIATNLRTDVINHQKEVKQNEIDTAANNLKEAIQKFKDAIKTK